MGGAILAMHNCLHLYDSCLYILEGTEKEGKNIDQKVILSLLCLVLSPDIETIDGVTGETVTGSLPEIGTEIETEIGAETDQGT